MRRFVVAVVATATALGLAAPAFADSVVVRDVDTSRFPVVTVSALVNGPTPDPATFTLRENGKPVKPLRVVPLTKTSVPVGIVLAVDVSGSMNQSNKLAEAKAAATQFVAQKQSADEVAIVAFDNGVHVVTNFTRDAGQ